MQTVQLPPQPPRIHVSDEIFWELCQQNPELKLERTATGELIVNPPTGSETGSAKWDYGGQLWFWNKQSGLGVGFDSSSGFTLPNGSTRSPDLSWIQKDRWEALSKSERERFAPIAPDFVLELMSPNDPWGDARVKMQEYIENGVRQGWLIYPRSKTIEIYRPEQPVQIVKIPCTLNGEDILPGFKLEV
ncbi:MAG: Uma2 family endonuclease [Microcoleaceae cyanobacterium]